MKKLYFFIVSLFLCYNIAEAQTPTYASVPGPENVLVVYNSLSDTSKLVKYYYVNARGIPTVSELNKQLNNFKS